MSVELKVSPHVLMDVSQCQTRGWLRHVKGMTSPGEAIRAVAGQAIHAAIAEFLRSDLPCPPDAHLGFPCNHILSPNADRQAALDAFHTIYDPAFARLAPEKLDQSLTPQNLHRIVARWCEMHPPSALPWKRVLLVEEAFVSREFCIGADHTGGGDIHVKLIVRPDLVVEDFDGRVRWVDVKTTGWHITDTGWRNQLRLSSQTQLYSDAVAQRYGERAVLGGWVAAMELKNLPGASAPKLKKNGEPAKARLCAEHGRPYSECGEEHVKAEIIECLTTPELVARAVRDAEQSARDFVKLQSITDVAELDMRGAERGACRFCPGQEFCLASRPVEAIESMMIYEPYLVETGQRI